MDAARDRARDRVGGDHAEFGEAEQRIDRLLAGRGGKHHVAIESAHARDRSRGPFRFARSSRAAWPAAFVSTASVTTTTSVVFSDGVASGPPLSRALSMSGVNEGGSPRPPNSSFSLERRRPEPRPVADRHAADGVDDGERRRP